MLNSFKNLQSLLSHAALLATPTLSTALVIFLIAVTKQLKGGRIYFGSQFGGTYYVQESVVVGLKAGAICILADQETMTMTKKTLFRN